MTSRQWAEWVAYDLISPIDREWRADLRAGIVAATQANCHRGKNTKAFRPQDFMPKWYEGESEAAKPQSIKAAFKAVKKQLRGRK